MARHQRDGSACALALLMALVPLNASAEDSASLEKFRAHVQQAVEYKTAGELRAAIAEFEKARAIADHPKFALAVGRLHEEIGDCAAAKSEFQRGLNDKRSGEELVEKIKEELGANATCVDQGELAVECDPQGATVTAGDQSASCPANLSLPAGEHAVRVSAPGRVTRTMTVKVEPAGQHQERVELGRTWQKPAVTYTKYGAIGLGGALILGGIISDASAGSRQDELAAASSAGDVSRANALAAEADSAQGRTVALYTVGALFAAGGTALWIYDAEVEEWLGGKGDTASNDASGAQMGVSTNGASIWGTLRW